MIQDLSVAEAGYLCGYMPPETLHAAVSQLALGISGTDILRQGTCLIPVEQIPASRLHSLAVFGNKNNECEEMLQEAEMADGAYISQDGGFLLLIHPQEDMISEVLTACSEKLMHLSVWHSDLDHLPGLERLTGLATLHLTSCKYLAHLSGLQKLTGLTELHLSMCCIITELPGLANLRQLTSLKLDQCWSLPSLSGLENLTQLTTLFVSGCIRLTKLPDLERLSRLTELDLTQCAYLTAVPGLGSLTQLTSLNLSDCRKITELPGLNHLRQLTALDLARCVCLTTLPELDNLTQLTSLILSGCERLTELKGLQNLSRLTHLDLRQCHSLIQLAGTEALTGLIELHLSGCYLLPRIPCLQNMPHLTALDLSKCRSITSLPDLEDLTNLTTVTLYECTNLTDLSGLTQLKKLTRLNLAGCHRLEKLPALNTLPALSIVNLSECIALQEADLSGCSSLTMVGLSKCVCLKRVNLSHCKNLTTLDLTACDGLTGVILHGCEKLSVLSLSLRDHLQQLDVSGCKSLAGLSLNTCRQLTTLTGLCDLKQLTSIDLVHCRSLTQLDGLDQLTQVAKLDLEDCRSLKTLPTLQNLPRLKSLAISGCNSLSRIPCLKNLPQLTELFISNCRSLEVLDGLENLPRLNRLTIADCSKLAVISDFHHLPQLTRLELSNCHRLTGLPKLESLTQLTSLKLTNRALFHLSGLENLTQLTHLDLSGCNLLANLSGLENLTQLTHLDLSGCDLLANLSGLENLTRLGILNLSGCSNLTALSGLHKLTQLDILNLSGCKRLTTIPSMECLPNLSYLSLANCVSLSPITGLERLTRLTDLNLSGIKLQTIPDSIQKIKSLRTLSLQDLMLKDLPDWLPEIAEEFSLNSFNWHSGTDRAIVNFCDTTVEGVDMSIFEQPYEIVVKWFDERKKGRTQRLDEIKVIFLGDGEAGKSYTISRLMNNGGTPVDYQGIRTPGIAIRNHLCQFEDREFKVNYWDFGGQEIMHSMHRIFLTNRTMYVVLVSASDPDPDARARYWLRNIQSFAPNAPVLLALNKIDIAPHVSLDVRALRVENSSLTQIVRLSSLTFDRAQFDREFRHVLLREIIHTGMLDVVWPKSWIEVKNRLENMGNTHIPVRDYERICKECQVGDVQMTLLHWFNDLGVSFCFRDSYQLKHQVILNPKWITNGLYIILFNPCRDVVNGIVPHESIYELLEKAPNDPAIQCTDCTAEYEIPRDAEYVLGIMRKFQLSFCISEDTEFIPMLCQAHPALDVSQFVQDKSVLEFHMVFEYLPNNVLHRLMVKQYAELDKYYVWKTGARFVLPGTGLSAVVAMDGNTLKFYIIQADPMYPAKTYLTILKAHTDSIWKQMGLRPPDEAVVFKSGNKTETFDYGELKYALANGIAETYSRMLKRPIPVADILRRSGLDELAEYEVRPAHGRHLAKPDRRNHSIDARDLLEYIVHSCRNIQAEPAYGSTGDRSDKENLRNRRIRDDLKMRLEKTCYHISDQPQRGRSGTGQHVGSLDLLLEDASGTPWTVIEALRISDTDKKEWNDHLIKLLGNYNYAGLKFAYLLTYVDANEQEFDDILIKYLKHIRTYDPGSYKCKPETYHELNTGQDLQYIHRVACDYTCGSAQVTVYHLFVMVKPQPAKPVSSIS